MSGDKDSTQNGSFEWIQASLVRSFYRCESQVIYLKPLKTKKVRKIQMLKVNSTLFLTADSLRFLLMAQRRHKQNLWSIL